MVHAKLIRTAISGILLTLAILVSAPVSAQVVTSSDIQRLQDMTYDIGDDIGRISDSREMSRMRTDLETLREEVIYLKVKLRKEGAVDRSEYVAVRDRLQDLRTRSSSRFGTTGRTDTRRDETRGTTGRTIGGFDIPAGTEIDVRLQSRLSSETAQVEDRVQAVTIVDLMREGRVLIPAGSIVRGIVTNVERATRLDRKGSMTLSFDQIQIGGRSYDIDAQATQVFESEGLMGEKERIGAGAAIGGILGGILGGLKGALAGILIGGGGTVLATEGKDVVLPEGTVLRIRFDRGVELR